MSASLNNRSSLRRMLALSTTLGGFLALPAAAQTISLPNSGSIENVSVSLLGSGPQLSTSNNDTRLNVNLRAATTVIDWRGFNIPEDHTINFSNGRIVPGPAAVLNRDVSANPSRLLGNLTSGADVSVWVMNGNGILVGSKAAFNTGSLVLSTLDISPSDFINANGTYRLRAGTGKEQSAITVTNGATFTIEGQTRGLVMVAPKIDAQGEFVARGQDVAFVSAADVTLDYRAGSPLSVTINRGSAVAGTGQLIQGKVEGNNALFALASQDTITDALLSVRADVTSVSVGSRGIVLSAGRTSDVAGVSMGSDTAATGGIAGVAAEGTFRTFGNTGAIAIASTGGASVRGTVATRGDVTVAAGRALAVTAGITSLDDIRLTAATIGFGDDTAGAALQATDQLQLTATAGSITATGPLLLQSGSTGDDSMVIETRGTSGGDILLGSESTLIAGGDRRGVLSLRLRTGANAVTLGDVSARGLRSAAGTAGLTNGLRTTGQVDLGNVNLRDALLIDAGGIAAGNLGSDQRIDLVSAAAIGADAVDARGGPATLDAGGAVTIGDVVRTGGGQSDVVIDAAGAVSLGDVLAGRDVLIGRAAPAGTVTIAGNVGAGRDYRIAASAITLGSEQDASQTAGRTVNMTAGSGGITGLGGLTLRSDAGGGDSGITLAIDPARATAGTGTIDFAPESRILAGGDRNADLRIRSFDAAGIVRLGDVFARSLLGATGDAGFTAGLVRTGELRAGDVGTRGALLLSGGTVQTGALGTSGDVQVRGADTVTVGGLTSGGQITVDAGGALTVGGATAANGAVSLAGAAVDLQGTSLRSGGTIDVLARSGGITSGDALAVASTSLQSADFIRLRAAGAQGITLAEGSSITAGTNQALGVRVFTAAGAPLALGDVTAQSLGMLAAVESDPYGVAGAFRAEGSLSFGRLDLVQGLTAQSTAGDLSVAAITVRGAGQGIDLRAAAGTLSVPSDLSASGAITLVSGGALTLGTVESRDAALSISSGGALATGGLRGATGVTATGTSATLGTVEGGSGVVALTATAGDLVFGGAQGGSLTLTAASGLLDARGALVARDGAITADARDALTADGGVTAAGGGVRLISAQGALSTIGGVRAGGDVTLSGTTITLGGINQARSSYTATARAGGIVRGGEIGSIRSDGDDSGGEGITLSATGGAIALGDTRLAAGSGAVALTTDGGGIIVGNVEAASLTATGATIEGAAIRTGDLTLATGLDLTAAGAVRTGAIRVADGAVTVTSRADEVATGTIEADGAATLAGTAVAFGDVTTGGLNAQASRGAIAGGAITTDGAVTVDAAGAVALGRVTGDGDVAISGTGPVSVTKVIAAGGATISGSARDVDVVVAEGVDAVGAATVRSGGNILTPFVISRTGDLTVAAPNGRVAGLQAGSGTDLSAGPGGAFSLTVGTEATLGTVVGGNIAITATAISANSIVGGDAPVTLRATAGDLTIFGPVTGSDVSLIAVGNTRLGAVDASGVVTIGGDASLSFGTVTGASITASGGVIAGDALRSAGAIDVTGDDLSLGTLNGGTATVDTTGALGIDTVDATRDATLTGGGQVTLGTVTTGGDLTVAAGGLDVTGTIAGAGVSLETSGAMQLAAVEATGAVSLTSGERLAFGSVTGASITAIGGVIAGDALQSAGAVDITGDDLSLGTLNGGTVTVDTTGALAIDMVDVTRDATLTGGGQVTLGTVTTGGDLMVAAGGLDVTGTIAGAGVSLETSGAMQLAAVEATGAVSLTSGERLAFGSVTGASITAIGGVIAGDALQSAGAVDITGDDLSLGTLNGGTVTVDTTGALAIDMVDVTRDATLTGGGQVTLGTVTTGGDLAVAAGGLDVIGTVTAAGVSLETNGAMQLAGVEATGAVSLTSGERLAFGTVTGASITASGGTIAGDVLQSAGAVDITGGDLSLGTLNGGTLTADMAGTLAIDTVVATGGATLASDGAATLGTLTTGGAAAITTSGAASIAGAVRTGGDYRVTAGAIVLGGEGVVQQADGAVQLVATTGELRGNRGLSLIGGAGAMVLDGAGGVALGDTNVRTGGTLALRAGSGTTIRLGTVAARAIGGYDGRAVTARLMHDGAFDAGDITTGDVAITLSRGDLTTGRVTASGAVSLVADAGTVTTGDLTAVTLDAGAAGALSLGATTVSGAARLQGGAVSAPSVRAGTLAITTAGTLGGAADGRAALSTTGGDLTVDAGTARLATLDSADAATLRVGTIDAAGRLAAARQLLIDARSALALGEAAAGADMTLTSAAAISTGALTAAGKLAATGSAIDLGSATASGGIALEARGTVRAGALSAGPSLTIRAGDAELSGAVRATDVRFATADPAAAALRIGDGTATDGFRLSATEVGLIAAERLAFDAGAGAMEIGTVALTPTIARSVAMLSTGDVRVTGQVASSGGAQAIRIGGDAAEGSARSIHVVSTSDAGGRIYAEGADLELRGARIAVGLAPGFIDTLEPGANGLAQATALIGNANSALYNPLLGGAFYAADATTTVAARSLTVRFADYALFQNTAIPGENSAVSLGSAASPALPALRVSSFGTPGQASFAIFGTINGIAGAGAALLGNPVIDLDATLLSNSRINGCLAGSSAGCLTTIVIQPTLQVFNWNSEAVFGIRQDVALPFSPVIGANNEELLSGLPALAPQELDAMPALQEPKP